MNDRYRNLSYLGGGAFGEVWLAVDSWTAQHVAVKYLKKDDHDAQDRFRREARILHEQAKNRYIVDLLDWNFDTDVPYIVVEYCSGGSLRGWVGQNRPWPEVVSILTHAAEGLAGIHAANGFHRDIKPENLLIAIDATTNTYTIKVADFGLARLPSRFSSNMTNSPAGTRGYMAPEIINGGAYHASADIFSLGVVATELLTGSRELASLRSAVIPTSLLHLILRMRSIDSAVRPNCQQVTRELIALLNAPIQFQAQPPLPVSAPTGASNGNGGGGAFLIGLAALAAGAVLAVASGGSSNWDSSVGRYRGKDGRFKKG